MATGKGNIKNFSKDRGFEVIPRDLLQHCDKRKHGDDGLSLEAIGLLVNLQSYPEDWELYKTELYNRYSKNGRRKVESAWDLLVEKKYIVQFKKRNGRKYDYIYYFSVEPFNEEMIRSIEESEQAKAVSDFKLKSDDNPQENNDNLECTKRTVQNEHSKMNSTKRTDNKEHSHYNTQQHNTDITNEYSEESDTENHSSHSNHESNSNIEFNYYTDELPDLLRTVLKPFNISEIKIIKKLIRKSLNHVNEQYDYPELDIAAVTHDIVKTINKVQYRRKLKHEEYGSYESIEELQPFLFTSFKNAFLDYQNKQNPNESSINDHGEAFNDFEYKTIEKNSKAPSKPIYASEDKETKKMIEAFRNS